MEKIAAAAPAFSGGPLKTQKQILPAAIFLLLEAKQKQTISRRKHLSFLLAYSCLVRKESGSNVLFERPKGLKEASGAPLLVASQKSLVALLVFVSNEHE